VSASTVPAATAPKRYVRGRVRIARGVIVVATFFVLLALWQGYVTFIYDSPIALPTPASTWEAFLELVESGELQEALVESFTVLLAGGVPGVVIGIFAGLAIGATRPLDTAFSPYIFAFYATPFPALIPIFILLFGLGVVGKGMIVFTLVVTTVLLQTVAGVKTVDPRFLEAARSFGSSAPRMLFEVQMPAAMSFIVAGVRLAVGRALVGVVIAEFDTALSGLGALIFRYAGRLQLSEAFVPAVVLAATGIVLSIVLRRLEMRFERWRQVG
jgi:ABC-type nitrate/sulfonate/bicarbonate transport system permease component